MNYMQSCCVIVLTAEKMGMKPNCTDLARETLEGKDPGIILTVGIEKESVAIHNRIAGYPDQVSTANAISIDVMRQYGLKSARA